ncbi:MAG: PQQ-like beta-propeller repeat protein [Polyangiaceae bacterium]|nr:PQQ-like beta-propeller repeat protein [Polyangiaceae bacterium]
MKTARSFLLLLLVGTGLACAEGTKREEHPSEPAEPQAGAGGAGGVPFAGYDPNEKAPQSNKQTPTDGSCGQQVNCTVAPGSVCEPSSVEACYEGPTGTEGVGVCAPGVRLCNAYGTAFSPCGGQVLPHPDDCSQPTASVCDGSPPPCHALTSAEMKGYSSHRVVAMGQSGSVRGYVELYGSQDLLQLVIERIEGDSTLWTKRFDITVDDYYAPLKAVAVDDSGAVFLAIRVERTVKLHGQLLWDDAAVIVKLDPSGEIVWDHQLGNHDVQLAGLTTQNGYVWVAGAFAGAITFGEETLPSVWMDGFLVNLDRNGNFLWGKRTDAVGDEWYGGLAVDDAGNSFVGGGLHGCGCDPRKLVIRSYDRHGNSRFDKEIMTRSPAQITQLVLHHEDGIYVTGRLGFGTGNTVDFGNGPLDGRMFLAKLTRNGEPVWGRTVNDPPVGPAMGGYVGVHPDGRVIWVNQDQYDFWFRAFDPIDGTALWERKFIADGGCQTYDDAYVCSGWGIFGFAMFPDGSFEIGGSFGGHLDIGGAEPLFSSAGAGFFARYSP